VQQFVALINVRLSAAVNELLVVQKRLAEELSLCLSSKLQQWVGGSRRRC